MDLRMLSYEFVILEEQGAQCEFGIDDIYWDGGTTGVAHETLPPARFELHRNYPNPFNPSTPFSFNLKEASDITLDIYTLQGQRVKVLSSGSFGAGDHSITWNGTDSDGRALASGVYFYRLNTSHGSDTRKCILLK
jgi:hypothetical protein